MRFPNEDDGEDGKFSSSAETFEDDFAPNRRRANNPNDAKPDRISASTSNGSLEDESTEDSNKSLGFNQKRQPENERENGESSDSKTLMYSDEEIDFSGPAYGFYTLSDNKQKDARNSTNSSSKIRTHGRKNNLLKLNVPEFSSKLKEEIKSLDDSGEERSDFDQSAVIERVNQHFKDASENNGNFSSDEEDAEKAKKDLSSQIIDMLQDISHLALQIARRNNELKKSDGSHIPDATNDKPSGSGSSASGKADTEFLVSDAEAAPPSSPEPEQVTSRDSITSQEERRTESNDTSIHGGLRELPVGVFELRKIDANKKVVVRYFDWFPEEVDWRWQKGLEELNETAHVTPLLAKEHYVKVQFVPKGRRLRTSMAEEQLQLVQLGSRAKFESEKPHKIGSDEYRKKSEPQSTLQSWVEMVSASKEIKPLTSSSMHEDDWRITQRLWEFFDKLQADGYGEGPPLLIKLSDENSLEDAYDILNAPSEIPLGYYRELRVTYYDNLEETLQNEKDNPYLPDDEDTLKFFSEMAETLFSPTQLHLFDYPSKATKQLHLNPETSSPWKWVRFAGTILALSILHQHPLGVNLSRCFLECLLNRPHDHLEYLKEIDHFLYERLIWIRDNNMDQVGKDLRFTVRESLGKENSFDQVLVENGRNVKVTEDNKFLYIQRVLQFKLDERCFSQLKEFRSGFQKVLDLDHMSMFTESELQCLVDNKSTVRIHDYDKKVIDVKRVDSW